MIKYGLIKIFKTLNRILASIMIIKSINEGIQGEVGGPRFTIGTYLARVGGSIHRSKGIDKSKNCEKQENSVHGYCFLA
jgi:hypothetical protein